MGTLREIIYSETLTVIGFYEVDEENDMLKMLKKSYKDVCLSQTGKDKPCILVNRVIRKR